MKIICVDDEAFALKLTASMCEKLRQRPEVTGFGGAEEALQYLKEHKTDIAMLDICMPRMTGLELAARIRELWPDVAVIFVTEHAQYALEALKLHVSGYVLKPVDMEDLQAEVDHAAQGRPAENRQTRGRVAAEKPEHIEVQTFGEFNVYVNGEPVYFNRSRAKEALAFLVDRQGGYMTRAAIFESLWGDEAKYNRQMQKYLDVILASMRDTLNANGIGDIIERSKGCFRVCPEKFSCDLYRFFDGDIRTVDAYRGEYMASYAWANMTEAYVSHVRGIM